jgi:uncharacterized protein YyaL (SSP411 family)
MPSGNGIAAKVLGRLGNLLGESRYLTAADQTLKALWPGIQTMPHGHASLLVALEESLYPYQTIVIRGAAGAVTGWQRLATHPYAPRRLTLTIPDNIDKLPGQLAERSARHETVAYCCNGHTCSAPITDSTVFSSTLSNNDMKDTP